MALPAAAVAGSGVPLTAKAAAIYEDLLLRGADPSSLDCDLLLLRVRHAELQAAVDRASIDELLGSPRRLAAVRFLFRHCVDALKDAGSHTVVLHALETLADLVFALAGKRFHNFAEEMMELMCGFQQVDVLLGDLVDAVREMLGGRRRQIWEQTDVLGALFKMLLVFANASGNLHSNFLMEFLQDAQIFHDVRHFLTAWQQSAAPSRSSATRASVKNKALLFMLVSLHFRQYDAANKFKGWIAEAPKSELQALGETLFDVARISENVYELATGSDSPFSIGSISGYVSDLVSGIQSMFYTRTISSSGKFDAEANLKSEDEMAEAQELVKEYQWTMVISPLIFFYQLLYGHSKFMSSICELKREQVVFPRLLDLNGEGLVPENSRILVVPTNSCKLILKMLTVCSSVLVQAEDSESDHLLIRMALVILKVWAEDPAGCIVLFDSVKVHEFGICTLRNGSVRSRLCKGPIICGLFAILRGFHQRCFSAPFSALDVHFMFMELTNEIVFRLLVFGSENSTLCWSDQRIQKSFFEFVRSLFALVIQLYSLVSTPSTLSRFKYAFSLFSSSLSLSQAIVAVSLQIFSNKSVRAEFLVDLAKNANFFQKMKEWISDYRGKHFEVESKIEIGQDIEFISRIQESSEYLSTVSAYLYRYINSYCSTVWNGKFNLQTLSNRQQIEVSESALSGYQLPEHKLLWTFVKYVENPKEIPFFNHCISQLLRKFVILNVDSDAVRILNGIYHE